MLFKSFDYPILLTYGPFLAKISLMLGLKKLVKETIFHQFCGGEDIHECTKTIENLSKSGIGTILDYSVEGEDNETAFEKTKVEIIRTIHTSSGNEKVPFAVFKVTGIISQELLEKKSNGSAFSDSEQSLWNNGTARFNQICTEAYSNHVRLFIDAEETWIQPAIDELAENAMAEFNTERCIIYNTVQLYRVDRLSYLKKQIEENTHFLGFKLVRGAYMEKERARANELKYLDPIQPNKESTDRDYNEALNLCIKNIQKVSICAGTHNEVSSLNGVQWLQEMNVASTDSRMYFSQLLGMSDHISFNLSNAGYNVAKYVPYGPVSAVIPYLTRRAQENSSVAGQIGRELSLIQTELTRRSK
jgi:proline dehydrogenase